MVTHLYVRTEPTTLGHRVFLENPVGRLNLSWHLLKLDAQERVRSIRVMIDASTVMIKAANDFNPDPLNPYRIGQEVILKHLGLEAKVSGYVWSQPVGGLPHIVLYELDNGAKVCREMIEPRTKK
jgi:hypothetical protein